MCVKKSSTLNILASLDLAIWWISEDFLNGCFWECSNFLIGCIWNQWYLVFFLLFASSLSQPYLRVDTFNCLSIITNTWEYAYNISRSRRQKKIPQSVQASFLPEDPSQLFHELVHLSLKFYPVNMHKQDWDHSNLAAKHRTTYTKYESTRQISSSVEYTWSKKIETFRYAMKW